MWRDPAGRRLILRGIALTIEALVYVALVAWSMARMVGWL